MATVKHKTVTLKWDKVNSEASSKGKKGSEVGNTQGKGQTIGK